jgi:hypothetical protein
VRTEQSDHRSNRWDGYAALDRHARTIRRKDVTEATTWARQHYRNLLDRLAQ